VDRTSSPALRSVAENGPDGWEIEILGVMRSATRQTEPIWDPAAEKMRS